MACREIEEISKQFNLITEKPVKFLAVQSDVTNNIKNLVKSLYDITKAKEKLVKKGNKSALLELIVQDFDEEQIWQQIELQNTERWDQFVSEVSNFISTGKDLVFPVTTEIDMLQTSDENVVESDVNNFHNDSKNYSDESIEKRETIDGKIQKKKKRKQLKSSVVDDKFFKLQEMEQFLLNEEKGKTEKFDSGDDDDESINMFEDMDADEDGDENAMMYEDFFDPADGENDFDTNGDLNKSNEKYNLEESDESNELDKNDLEQESGKDQNKTDVNKKKPQKKVHFAQESSSDDEDSETGLEPTQTLDEDKRKSEFELRQQRLKQKIERLEQKTLKEAPWQLKGEVDANRRPQNSLLQEVVDFDLTSRPPPIITEQTTFNLEDMVKQRVKDKAWDDVFKKEKPADDQLVFHKKEILDHSKSKLSLAQVYEAEYLKQKQALSGEDQEEKEPEAHKEIRDTMSKLFAKLDALCHYHYTPKAAQAEVNIVTNTPAISIEEVAPLATSDAMLLAPEEIKKKQKGDLTARDERTQADKNRERRKKKKLQREKGKVNKVTEQRNTKKGIEANDKSLKTSKAFFQQLNDDAKSILKSNKHKKM